MIEKKTIIFNKKDKIVIHRPFSMNETRIEKINFEDISHVEILFYDPLMLRQKNSCATTENVLGKFDVLSVRCIYLRYQGASEI